MSDEGEGRTSTRRHIHRRRECIEAQKRYFDTVQAAISQASATGERATVEAEDGAEAYAYIHPRGIAWGVNAAGSGVNVLRGFAGRMERTRR